MSIYVVTGKPRHGKSYLVVSQIPGWLQDGERIFSNVKIDVTKISYKERLFSRKKYYTNEIVGDIYNPDDLKNEKKQVFYWRNLHEWNKMEKGIIIVDEAQKFFNARSWSQLSEDTEAKLQEHGKEDLDVWATTQHYSRIDVTLRILVEQYFKVKMIWGNPDNARGPLFGLIPKRSHVESWLLEDLERIERLGKKALEDDEMQPEQSYSFFIRKKYYSIYDTRAKVGRSLPMPLIHKERNCAICGTRKIEHV